MTPFGLFVFFSLFLINSMVAPSPLGVFILQAQGVQNEAHNYVIAPMPTKASNVQITSGSPTPTNPPLGGPDLPYPMSFPKMLAGILWFEQTPQMAAYQITPAQSRQLLPVVLKLKKNWTNVLGGTNILKNHMSCEQLKFIDAHKAELELSSFKEAVRTKITQQYGEIPPDLSDTNFEIAHAYYFLKNRRDANMHIPWETCGNWGNQASTPESKNKKFQGSVFDVALGLLLFEDHAKLRISSEQAGALFREFQELVGNIRVTYAMEERMRQILTDDQKNAIADNIKAITVLKHNLAGSGVGEEDGVSGRVVNLLAEKIVNN